MRKCTCGKVDLGYAHSKTHGDGWVHIAFAPCYYVEDRKAINTPQSDTPTPRCEAFKFWSDIGGWVVSLSDARTLERELNAANEKLHCDGLGACSDSKTCPICRLVSEQLTNDQLRTTNAALEKQVEELKVFIHEVGRGEHDSLLRRERDSFRAQLAECEKDKERLDWLEKKTPLAIWAGSFSDSDYNISLGRVGAPICTISTMDDDGHEVDEEIAGGDSLRTAIDKAIAATKGEK